MTETDAELVERMQRQIMESGSWAALIEKHEDMARLARLARRGAAVQWRPMKDIDKCEEALAISMVGRDRIYGPYIAERERDRWRTDDGSTVYPTHFISLAALGEPNE